MCNERVQNCYSFQSVGADPPLLKPLKCIWGREVVGLWTLKKVDLVSTQYFLIRLKLIIIFLK